MADASTLVDPTPAPEEGGAEVSSHSATAATRDSPQSGAHDGSVSTVAPAGDAEASTHASPTAAMDAREIAVTLQDEDGEPYWWYPHRDGHTTREPPDALKTRIMAEAEYDAWTNECAAGIETSEEAAPTRGATGQRRGSAITSVTVVSGIDDWQTFADEGTGERYYFSPSRGASRWTRPKTQAAPTSGSEPAGAGNSAHVPDDMLQRFAAVQQELCEVTRERDNLRQKVDDLESTNARLQRDLEASQQQLAAALKSAAEAVAAAEMAKRELADATAELSSALSLRASPTRSMGPMSPALVVPPSPLPLGARAFAGDEDARKLGPSAPQGSRRNFGLSAIGRSARGAAATGAGITALGASARSCAAKPGLQGEAAAASDPVMRRSFSLDSSMSGELENTPPSPASRPQVYPASAGITLSQLSFLKSVPLFHSFSEDKFLRLAAKLQRIDFVPDQLIIRQGDPPNGNFYIIESGRVRVHVKPAGNTTSPNSTARASARGLLKLTSATSEAFAAASTASTTDGTDVEAVDTTQLSVARSSGPLSAQVVAACTTASVPRAMPPSVPPPVPLLRSGSDPVRHPSDTPSARDGDGIMAAAGASRVLRHSDGMQASASHAAPGSMESARDLTTPHDRDGAPVDALDSDVPIHGGRVVDAYVDEAEDDDENDTHFGPVVAELSKGMFFGERALLTSEPRAATCIASSKVVCYALDRKAFEDVLSGVGDFLGEYSRKNYGTETPETMALARHVHSYRLMLERMTEHRVDTDRLVETDADLPPARALAEVMALFAPEISLLEVIGRVRRVLKSVVDAEYVHVMVYDADRSELVILGRQERDATRGMEGGMSTEGGAARASLPMEDVLPALHDLGGSVTMEGNYRIPLSRCGALEHVIVSMEPLMSADIALDSRFNATTAAPTPSVSPRAITWLQQQRRLDTLLNMVDHTRSLFVAPIVDADGHVLGAVLAINKMRECDVAASDQASTTLMTASTVPVCAAESLTAPAGDSAAADSATQHATAEEEEDDGIDSERPGVGARASVASDASTTGGANPNRRLRRLTAMRTWTLVKEPAVGQRSSVPTALGKQFVLSRRSTTYCDAPTGVFSARDEEVITGVAEALSLAFDDRRLEVDTLIAARECTPLHSLSTPFSFVLLAAGNLPNMLMPKPPPPTPGKPGPAAGSSAATAPARLRAASGTGSTLSRTVSFPQIPSLTQRCAGGVVVQAHLLHGSNVLCTLACDPQQSFAQTDGVRSGVVFNRAMTATPIACCNLPVATRLVITLSAKDGTPVGWAGCGLFSSQQMLQSGSLILPLWPGRVNLDSVCHVTSLSNTAADETSPFISITLPAFDKPVVRLGLTPVRDVPADVLARMTVAEYNAVRERVVHIAKRDPLYSMTAEEARLIWQCREFLTSIPEALPKFLHAVRWDCAAAVDEAHRLLLSWRPLTPPQALELLQASFADPVVRAYAVSRLEMLDDGDLYTFMLQLCQVLKFEPFLDSSLTRFLLRRSLRRPRLIGHVLFWFLKAEMHIPEVAERYGAILQQYLLNCNDHRTELGHQMFVMAKLEDISAKVKACDSKEARLDTLRKELPRIVFPDQFQLPLSPHMVARGLVVEKCRVMSSKKLPLWLVFDAVSPPSSAAETSTPTASTVNVLFKAGDDLRQDQLTLQLLQVMDRLWKAESLDLRMSPYRCVSTGDEIGMIEAVLNSNTLAGIVAESVDPAAKGWRRKVSAALQVYQDFVYREWLEAQPGNEGNMAVVEDNFVRSCAGYCVATYVLGIGDRHNDNLMLTRDGKLFHIDFGHFLGNFKSKMGYKRERAPFIFTPAFAAVMGGKGSEQYKRFEQLCCTAYNVIRRHGRLLINLFYLMIASGLPELREVKDMDWLREKLMMDATDEEAAEHFRKQIKISLSTRATQLNDAVHLIAHA